MSMPRSSFPTKLRNLTLPIILGLILTTAVQQVSAADPPLRPDAASFAVKSVKDVVYYEGPDADPVKHKLDLYLPRGGKDFPVIFFVHGGAWVQGDKSFLGVYGDLASFYARRGVGVVVTNYRLSPKVRHPEHIRDVARAFAWTHQHIKEYGGRPDEIFVCGHSAGAHLAALLTTDPKYLKSHDLGFSDVRGVIGVCGPYDLTVLPKKLNRAVFGDGPDAAREASPVHCVRAGSPPFLLLCAGKDLEGCGKNIADAFADAVHAKGGQAEVVEIASSSHNSILVGAASSDDPVSAAIFRFLNANRAKPDRPSTRDK
jgi:acetyl esterase/lipase